MDNQLKVRNISIQILRVAACLMVFVVHFGQRVGFSGTIRQLSDFGAYGVHLFFLISGYLCAMSFINKPNFNVKQYYIKRAITILPLYYLIILYYFITENILNIFVDVIPPDSLGLGWARYIFLLNGFVNADTYFWNNLGITWTIPVFAFFYLIAPWFLKRIKNIATSIVVLIFVSLLCISMNYFCPGRIFSNLPIFFIGVVVYTCTYKNCNKEASVIFLTLSLPFLLLNYYSEAYVLIFAGILSILVICVDSIKIPSKLKKIIIVLDKYSYSIYLMHGVVFCSILDRLNAIHTHKIIIVVVAILGTALSVFVVGKYVEKPLQSYLTKKFVKND